MFELVLIYMIKTQCFVNSNLLGIFLTCLSHSNLLLISCLLYRKGIKDFNCDLSIWGKQFQGIWRLYLTLQGWQKERRGHKKLLSSCDLYGNSNLGSMKSCLLWREWEEWEREWPPPRFHPKQHLLEPPLLS